MANQDISEMKFKTNFANSNSYGDRSVAWPHETYLVSKVDIMKNHRIIAPTDVRTFQSIFSHAEYIFLLHLAEYLSMNHPNDTQSVTVSVELFLSYSPCSRCANNIRDAIMDMRYKNISVNLTIHIGTFHRIYDFVDFPDDNSEGLIKLLSTPEVQLKTFNGLNDWKDFMEIVELPLHWIKYTQTKERIQREEIDNFILIGLKKKAEERLKEYAEAIRQGQNGNFGDFCQTMVMLCQHQQQKLQ